MANVDARSEESALDGVRSVSSEAQRVDQQRRPPLWEGIADVRLLGALAGRLLLQGRGLTAAVSLGMLLTVIALCLAPAYTAASASLAVQTNLSAAAPLDRNVEAYVTSIAPTPTAHARIATQVVRAATQTLGELSAPQSTAYAVTVPLPLAQVNQRTQGSESPSAAQIGVQLEGWDFSAAAAQMRFLAGGPPMATPPGQPTQVIVTVQMATDLHLQVGSTLVVAQFGRFGSAGAGLHAIVTGVWEPRQANAAFWNGVAFLGAPSGSLSTVYPLLTPASNFYNAMSQFSGLSVTQYWVFYTRVTHPTPQTLGTAPGSITRLRSHLETTILHLPGVTDVGVITQLDHLATSIQAQLQQLSLPVKALLLLIGALACVFVAITAQALTDATERALVTLRSRGASGAQLLGVVDLQAMLLAALALLVGPPLALLGAWALFAAGVAGAAPTANLAPVMTLSDVAQSMSFGALALWAAIGALVGISAVMVGARSTVGQTAATYARRQGRATSVSRRIAPRDVTVFLLIVVLALAGLGDLTHNGQSGSSSASGMSSSLLVMAAPALILLSGALLAARLAPIVASCALAVGLRRRGITLALSMAPLVRGTARFAQMALLTTLALGLACFALIFRASLMTAQTSAASYSVGSDARIVQHAAETQGFDTRLLATYSHVTGVQVVAPIYRTQETTPSVEGSLLVETLAVDPQRFVGAAAGVSWRADFAPQSLSALMSLLARPATVVAGAPAPWAIVSASYAARVDAHVGDHLTLLLNETSSAPMTFTIAAIVQAFPTLGPDEPGGFVVVSLPSFASALAAQQGAAAPTIGPNEFWVRMTTRGAADRALQRLMATAPQLDIAQVMLLSQANAAMAQSPVGVGMELLLLLSAGVASALAALGALIQTLAAAHRERVRFAILRTLGLSQRTLTLLPLQEVLLTQALGLLVGSAVGAILVFAVAPLLGMIAAASAPGQAGGSPILTVIPWQALALLFGALLLMALVVVTLSVWRLMRMNLNRRLRIGED